MGNDRRDTPASGRTSTEIRMDAVNLALPTNALANPAMAAAGDKAALPIDGESATIDFATLLAAGLNLQQQLPGEAHAATELACDQTDETQDALDPALLAVDPSQLPAAATPAPVVPAVIEHIVQAGKQLGQGDASKPAALDLHAAGLPHDAMKATTAAAEAASFAAAAEKSAAHGEAQFQAELAQQTRLAGLAENQRTDAAAEAAAHTLNLQSVEQRPATQQPTAVLDVSAPVSSPGFADALSQQVVWMVDKDAQIAELRINPPELGPVEVRLTVNGDQASAQFVAAHQEVREALETSIARLRESFAQAGIQLGQASVSAESFRDQSAGAQADSRSAARSSYGTSSAAGEAKAIGTAAVQIRRGLVDTFA